MNHTKKRRESEVYEDYWKFTAAHTNIFGTKFSNCLRVAVRFIDQNKEALTDNAQTGDFAESDLYLRLQEKIVEISGFEGEDAALSARKVINQFVKIGFIYPLLTGYDPRVRPFLLSEDKEKKRLLFSKIFYESSSLASDVTKDRTDLKHVAFLLKTLDKSGPLHKNDIIALMVTDIKNYRKGYLTRRELEKQYRFAVTDEFEDRKYNQISHLTNYLRHFVDLDYNKEKQEFRFRNDPEVADGFGERTYERDGVRHRIYKRELEEESMRVYGRKLCYAEKRPYRVLIASHIKPCAHCLKEQREDQAYDVNNGLLLSPTLDSYFDKWDISFDKEGSILFGRGVEESVREQFQNYALDQEILTTDRKKYLCGHRTLFYEKNS